VADPLEVSEPLAVIDWVGLWVCDCDMVRLCDELTVWDAVTDGVPELLCDCEGVSVDDGDTV
jgi:hypothetical protein